MPGAYGTTADIYRGLGAADRLSDTMSIGAALNGRFGYGFSIGM